LQEVRLAIATIPQTTDNIIFFFMEVFYLKG